MPSPYWESQMSGFNRAAGNIGTAMVAGPRMRAQAQLMAVRQAEQEQLAREAAARVGLINAQTGKASAETGSIQAQDEADNKISEGLKGYMADQSDPKALGTFFEGLGKKFKDPAKGAQALQRIAPLIQAMGGSTNYNQMAAEGGDAAKIAAIQEKAAAPMNVTGALMTPGGKILGVAPKNVPAGDVVVGQTDTPPLGQLAAGLPQQPKDSATDAEVNRALIKTVLQQNSDFSQSPAGVVTNTPAAIWEQIKNVVPQAAGAAPAAIKAIPVINSQEDYDALPAGARYRDSQGNIATKKQR